MNLPHGTRWYRIKPEAGNDKPIYWQLEGYTRVRCYIDDKPAHSYPVNMAEEAEAAGTLIRVEP